LKHRVYLHRLGCPKLDVDSDLLSGGLHQRGLEFTETSDGADTIIVSTCAFIGEARAEAIDAILKAVRWKEEQLGRRVYVIGCLPSRYSYQLNMEIPEVDGWFFQQQWSQALDIISGQSNGFSLSTRLEPALVRRRDHRGKIPEALETWLMSLRIRTKEPYAYVKIAEGCDRKCAYCAIPVIRGSYRSRPPDAILNEVRDLLKRGVREIIVIAEEINSYGHDLHPAASITTLLPKIGELVALAEKPAWVRVLYTHPPLYRESFIQALRHTPALVPYLDFPIEHADDTVLRAMRRGTTWTQMRHWIDRLRETIPGIALRSSVIVGHPGETVQEFETLLERLDEVQFERLGVFRYSEEEGTYAANLEAPPHEDASRREEEILTLAWEQAENWSRELLGQRAEVIIERAKDEHRFIGRSLWDAPEIDGEAEFWGDASIGEIVSGVIIETSPYMMKVRS